MKKKKATAEFSNLSDTDDLAVEDLISRTKDLYVLEQIATINGSSFTADDSHLPFDLEFPFPQTQILHSLQTPNHAPEFKQSQDKVAIAVAPMKANRRDQRLLLHHRRHPLAPRPRIPVSASSNPSLSPNPRPRCRIRAIARRSRDSRRPHERQLLLVLAEEANTKARAIKKGVSMSFKWMEEDEVSWDLGLFSDQEQKKLLEKAK
ncbi:hypothetical protein ACJRO7_033025 [Eucalyptus globulus]|uniref:Uncharacterized protein n=1 Tax=Eucalyptus globulus TaxID=34317 RepID=A0ABD3JJX2_EUCGL